MSESEVVMLKDIVTRIREEFISAVTVSMIRAGWSHARIRMVIKDAMSQVEVIDEEMVRIAFSDLEVQDEPSV
jgi:uncharacterized membrane-anchored protein